MKCLLVKQFWETVLLFENNGVTDGETLSAAAKTLMFLLRMRQGLTYNLIQTMFDYGKKDDLIDWFYQMCTIYYSKNNPIPQLFNQTGEEDGTKRKVFFRSLIESMSPLYK